MDINVRQKDKNLFDIDDTYAGNYTITMPFFKGDCHYPWQIRNAVVVPPKKGFDDTGSLSAKRVDVDGRVGTSSIPSVTSLYVSRNKIASIGNWFNYYYDVQLPACQTELHLPIIDTSATTSFACFWKATPNILAMMFISSKEEFISTSHPAFGKNLMKLPRKCES